MFNPEEVYFDSDYYYANYKSVFNTICSHIYCLNVAIEQGNSVRYYAGKLYNYTLIFEGYTDCLFDLCIIREYEYNSFYEFVKAIRIECLYYM